jgi:hypothetical protein
MIAGTSFDGKCRCAAKIPRQSQEALTVAVVVAVAVAVAG